jgi:predicted transglutaminase-like cysteine proteinase
MPLHSITAQLAGWLFLAAAALQSPAYGFEIKSQTAGAPPLTRNQPIAQKQIFASLPPASGRVVSSREPFAQMAVPVASGEMLSKWRGVETEIDAETAVLDRCRTQEECPRAARTFLDIVAQGQEHDGLARIGVINRAVNLAIVPTSDMDQWGVPDRWSPPLETLTTRRGDCEDYAIAKYVALIDAGVAKADVRLVILHNRFPQEDHAVVAARVNDAWFILDNRSLALVPAAELRGAIPLYVLDDTGGRIFVPGTASGGIS